MPYATTIVKIILVLTGLHVQGYAEGVGAYYHERPGLMREVCELRVQENWAPGLDCSWPCLVSGIEQHSLGEWWLVEVPGASMHV